MLLYDIKTSVTNKLSIGQLVIQTVWGRSIPGRLYGNTPQKCAILASGECVGRNKTSLIKMHKTGRKKPAGS